MCLETRRGYANGGQITKSEHHVGVLGKAVVRLGRAKCRCRSPDVSMYLDSSVKRLRD
jgi:hypothetical protein